MGTSESSATSSQYRAQGEAFLYSDEHGLAAFELSSASGVGKGNCALVCIAGLTDGLLSLRYLPTLAKVVSSTAERWRVVQPLLSSSYRGWGSGSLDEDAEEIALLLKHLAECRGVTDVVLLGHSTGAQDVVHFLRQLQEVEAISIPSSIGVRGAILQGGLSDREAVAATGGDAAEVAKFQEMASKMISSGKEREVMPREASLLLGPPHPVTAYRFASLTGRMTDDDMFSSDLTEEEMQDKLGHMLVPTLVVLSADDEYLPKSIDAKSLAEREVAAMAANCLRQAKAVVLDEGGHSLSTESSAQRFSEVVKDFLAGLTLSQHIQAKGIFEDTYGAVAKQLLEKSAGLPSGRPLLVALAGAPGSGKSTLAGLFKRLLAPQCCVMPMDGFHIPLAELRKRPDAAEAEYRRGAPDTFNPAPLKAALKEIQDAKGPEVVKIPGFDRAAGDPTPPGAICFDRSRHSIVLVEGLYLFYESAGWEGTAALFDLKIFLEADIGACIARVKERNKVIPGWKPEEMERRVDIVDRANAYLVAETAARADLTLRSSLPAP